MKKLFENTDADFCTLIDYVKTFVDRESENFQLFQLPPIQRNAVWNVAQIERLWDSLMRGFPIGSFLLCPRIKNESARDLLSGEQKHSDTDGYFLLDGQQRTRALLMGFIPNKDNSRLWIDLLPDLKFDNAEFNDRKFLLRVITSYQPWGMSDRNPAEKLNESTKFSAREEIGNPNLHYDYQVEIDDGSMANVENLSWPVRANLPVPLDALIQLFGGISGSFEVPAWEQVKLLIPKRYFKLGIVPANEPDHFLEISNALRHLLDTSSGYVKSRTIVLLFQNQRKNISQTNIQDEMEVLFRRVNAGGTVLQGEEMSYSLLKSSWDGAYDMVSTIVKDPVIGYLLPPTGIVMAATRLARFKQEANDSPNPGIGNFRKWIGENDSKGSFLGTMKKLLVPQESGNSIFHATLKLFCHSVIYREAIRDDIGLPPKLLLSIKPAFYHVVLIWIYKTMLNIEIIEKNRLNILRFLLYCYLTVDNQDKVSKEAISVIKEYNENEFPDNEIYKRLLEKDIAIRIPTPTQFSAPFEIPADGYLRHRSELFDIPDDPFNKFRLWFWEESRNILLWFQRNYAANWFKGYNPTSDDAYDTPYDWDHIMPYSHLITSGASPIIYSSDTDLNNKFYRNRHLYVNSIGNMRIWPFWANRSDNNRCHTYKLRMEEPDWQNDSIAKELGLPSVSDFIKASAIPLQDEQLWYNAGGNVRDWPKARRIAWQEAVEKRTCYIYEQLYDTFKFKNWNNEL